MRTFVSVLLACLFLSPCAASALTQAEVDGLVRQVDDRQRNSGDWKARVYIERKETDKNDVVYDAVVYRRDAEEQLMILFLRPRAERGKGYLRLDKNLWFYDPRVGRWERRTERERIGGTDSNRADFDQSRLAEEFDARFVEDGRLGRFNTHRIRLTAKEDADVAYPTVEMWIDAATGNVLKRLDFAASGRLMRRALYPRWERIHSPSKGDYVWFPREIRIFDEVERGNQTVVLIREVDLTSLPANIFTKAWLESQSR